MTSTNPKRVWLGYFLPPVLAVIGLMACITVSANVITSQSADCISCDGTASIAIALTATVQYEWYDDAGSLVFVDSNNSGSSQVSNLCPGLYQVQYTDGFNNGQSWFTINTPSLNAGQPVQDTICTSTGNVNLFNLLSSSPSSGGQWYSPSLSPISNILNSNNAVNGFYSYVLTDGVCSTTSGVYVTAIQNANPGLSTTYLICENYTPFNLTSVMAGNPDVGGTWFDVMGNLTSGMYDPAIDVTGLFTYHVDFVVGCPAAVSTLYVIENQLPDPGLDDVISVCPSGFAFEMTDMLGGTPASNGVWYNDQGDIVSSTFDPLVMPQGEYTYSVAGATPCPNAEAHLVVNFTGGINPGIGQNIEVCNNEPAFDLFSFITNTPDLGGEWTLQGNVVSSNFDPQNSTGGTYRYTVSGVGCQPLFTEVQVSVEQLLNAGPDFSTTMCYDENGLNLQSLLDPSAANGGEWRQGGAVISPIITPASGTISVYEYFLEGNVCLAQSAIYTIQTDSPVSAGDDQTILLCSSDPAYDLNGLVAGPGVGWEDQSGNAISNIIDPANGDAVAVCIVNSGNVCPNDQATYTFQVQQTSFESASSSSEICTTNTVIDLDAYAPVAGGVWSIGSLEINSVIPASPTSSALYTYSYNNGGICGVSALNVNLQIGNPASAGNDSFVSVCSDSAPFSLSDFIVDGSAMGTWFVGNAVVIDEMVYPATSNSEVFTYVVNSDNFCPADSATIEVVIVDAISLSPLADVSACVGDDLMIGVLAEGGISYSWSPSNLVANDELSETMINTTAAVTEVLTLTATNGVCYTSQSFTVVVNALPNIQLNAPADLCYGYELQVEASGAASYAWFVNGVENASTNASLSMQINEDVELSVVGTNQFGCETTETVNVGVLIAPESMFDIPAVAGCSPVSFNLYHDNGSDAEYTWLINDVPYFGTSVTLNESGLFDVTLLAVGDNGCVSSFTLDGIAEVYPLPTAAFTTVNSEVNILNPIVRFVNQSQGAVDYFWQFAGEGVSTEESPDYEFPAIAETGYEICLEAVNQFGCSDETCHDVYIKGDWFVYVPSAFSPDNDGLNEVFQPIVTGIDPDAYKFSVYDRWGILVFETTDPEGYWVGNVEDGEYYTPLDVYVWIVEVKDLYTANSHRFEGQVTLLR